ncbi:hypothetical protein JCM11641_000328 [Rhodosporidiobolus odoratus]
MQGPRLPSHSLANLPTLVPPCSPTVDHPLHPSSRPSSPSTPRSIPAPQPRPVKQPPDTEHSDGVTDSPAAESVSGGNNGQSRRDLEAARQGDDKPEGRRVRALKALKRHAAFVGPGVIASVAYLDPGNWSTDLAAGSAYGYSHLFIILFAGLMALLFQILSTRLGCVSDYDLATHCRFALYDRPGKWKLWCRYGLLWPLYLLAEGGIIFTDLAELLGSAIAINLIFPVIPLWAAVLLTSLDVFLILLLFNQYPARTVSTSMRCFELLIGLLVLTVLGSFVALLVEISPTWRDVFRGYVPSSGIVRGGGIYIAVGIVGATVMPHAFFIGSKMATMRRLKPSDYGESDDTLGSRDVEDFAASTGDKDGEGKKPSSGPAHPDQASPQARGRSRQQAAYRPYFPALHFPQPFRLDGVGYDLSTLSRARSASPPGHAGPSSRGGRRDTGEEIEAEELGQAGGDEEEDGGKAMMDDVAETTPSKSRPRLRSATSTASASPTKPTSRLSARAHPSRPKPTLACIRAHLTHACWDIAGSLLGFAVVVNSCILILGAAVFYYGPYRAGNPDGVSDLFDAYDIVKDYLGQAFAYLFAVALLAAGQSASLTVTLSGQIVSEGFLNWRTKPWKRRLITRCLNIVPSVAVAAAVGREGIDTLLIASQVALSIVLTFVLVPLILFTSQHSVMAVPISASSIPPPSPAPGASPSLSASSTTKPSARALLSTLNPLRRRHSPEGQVTYANPVWLVWLCAGLWLLVGIANVYALYDVAVHGA